MISRLTVAASDRKGRAMLTFVHRHSMETTRATFIQHQTLPTVGVSTVYPASEGYSGLYNKTVLA